MTMRRAYVLPMAVVVMIGAPVLGRSDTIIGNIAERSTEVVRFKNAGAGWQAAAENQKEPISERCDIETDGKGQAVFSWEDQRVGTHNRLQVQPDSRLGVAPGAEGRLYFTMRQGRFLWAGMTKLEVKAGHAETRTFGTALIVSYDSAADRAEILGIESRAEVRNVAVPSTTVPLGPKDLIVVVGREPPRKRHLSDEEYAERLRPFELPGDGAATSQTIGDTQLLGAAVPDPDRAPRGGPVVPPTDETGERRPDFDQPLPIVGAPRLGIQF